MALKFQPQVGTVLMCDFAGSVDPEMVKVRPVVILARNRTNKDLVTVVPLSTTKPFALQDCHYELPLNPLPGKQTTTCWAKCDMISTVSIARLDRVKTRTVKGREYVTPKLSDADFEAIRQAVVAALSLQALALRLAA